MPKGKKIEPIDLHELENNPVYDGMYDHLKTPLADTTPIGITPTGILPPDPKTLHVVRASDHPGAKADWPDQLNEEFGDTQAFAPTGPTPIVGVPTGTFSLSPEPIGISKDNEIDLDDVVAELAAAPRPSRSRGKVIPATRVEHGHSATQDALYWYLWRLGKSVKGSRSHFVQAGYGHIQAGIGVDRSNVQDAVRELQKKLSIRVVKANTVGSATIYEVFCCDDILTKRREAKLVWARTYGKRRVDLISEAELSSEVDGLTPIGTTPAGLLPVLLEPADITASVGEKPTETVGLTPTAGVGFTPIHEVSSVRL